MDSDFFRVDMSEVLNSVQSADVLTIYFPLLRKTLLIDGRSNEHDGPMVALVPMVATPDERLRELRRMRPRFPGPDSITFIPWPKYVDSLERLGVLEKLMARFVDGGYTSLVGECRDAFVELQRLERQEMYNAIKGETYDTLWDAQESGALDDEEADEDEF
ncbi:MAG: hypothetical protein WEB00_05520 [Dehalococcoidia bacterium]